MKIIYTFLLFSLFSLLSFIAAAQTSKTCLPLQMADEKNNNGLSYPEPDYLKYEYASGTHGLFPGVCYPVTDEKDMILEIQKDLSLPLHYSGAVKFTEKNLVTICKRDLTVSQTHMVGFIYDWANEKAGNAKNSANIALPAKLHGLVPVYNVPQRK